MFLSQCGSNLAVMAWRYPTRTWEGWGAQVASGSWADPDDDVPFDYASVTQEEAGCELAGLLFKLKVQNILSAKQACTLAFWAAKAGAVGDVQKMGVRPDSQTGKFSAKFDNVMGTVPDTSGMYLVEMARRVRHDASRRWDKIPIRLPHEVLAAELKESSEPVHELRRAKAANELPPIYTDHTEVKARPDDIIHPLTLYVDAVGYHRLDSALGIHLYFTLTGKRHMLAVVRKSEVCNCGCKGWCTLFPVWQALAWSFKHMLTGTHPQRRHDSSVFTPDEQGRQQVAGTPLGFRALCIIVKSDLAEHSHSFGLPGLGDTLSPCPLCFGTIDTFFKVNGLSPLGLGSARKGCDTYMRACANCETKLTVITREDQVRLRAALQYDKKKAGSYGRTFQLDFPELGISKGDRLEPTPTMPNVAFFDDAPVPFTVITWRPTLETGSRHRNPLFDPATGMSPLSLGIDWLHTLSLGVFQVTLQHVIWDLLEANIYNIGGPFSSVFELGVARLRQDLFRWYQTEQAQGRVHTRVQQFVPSMLGSATDKQFKLHASETNGFLHFSMTLLDTHGASLGRKHSLYKDAVGSMVKVCELIKRFPRRLPPREMQLFTDSVITHMRALEKLEIRPKPKHHFMLEMASRWLVIQ